MSSGPGERIGVLSVPEGVSMPAAIQPTKKTTHGMAIAAVFAALTGIHYRGWAVVELDSVPVTRKARDDAVANKAYLEHLLGISLGKAA